jgi:hypothetical protein
MCMVKRVKLVPNTYVTAPEQQEDDAYGFSIAERPAKVR